jgi:5-methylcytosine-specific restriction endonuclease McrA
LKTWALRKTIHDRERGACFYCLRRTPAHVHGLDHVVPRVRFGRNSYRNLVSCCLECNSRKGDRPARDFLRTLYRQGRLTAAELDARLRAMKGLAAGKLRPVLPPV